MRNEITYCTADVSKVKELATLNDVSVLKIGEKVYTRFSDKVTFISVKIGDNRKDISVLEKVYINSKL